MQMCDDAFIGYIDDSICGRFMAARYIMPMIVQPEWYLMHEAGQYREGHALPVPENWTMYMPHENMPNSCNMRLKYSVKGFAILLLKSIH